MRQLSAARWTRIRTPSLMIVSAGESKQVAGLRMERGPGFPYWSAGFFLSGLTEIVCTHQTYQFPGRSAVILPPKSPYRITIRKPQREIWMIFEPRPRLLQALLAPEVPAGVISVAFEDPGIWTGVQAGLRDLLRWWGSQPPQLPLAENALEKVLLLARWTHSLQKQPLLDERIARITAHIEAHLHEELSVEGLARVAGLSISRLAHVFRDLMGLSPMQFLEMRRIEKAKGLLLTTDLPVQEVGWLTGFPNAQHFSVRFRKMSGQSPRAFRQKPRRRFAELNPHEE
jgi:AraC family transcriptional regulator of arabinose operon